MSKNDAKAVGARIGQIRDNLGLTMEELGKKLDTSKGTVSKWEHGLNLPNRKRTKRIAELGGISVDELLGSNLNKIIGKRIYLIRKSLGLTMKEFGERMGNPVASDSIVSRWEKGVSVPNNERLKRIAELGEMTVEDLLSMQSNRTVEETIYEIKETFTDDEIKQIIRNLI